MHGKHRASYHSCTKERRQSVCGLSLFFGLMLTSGGPVVIEYNCRFGDPEAQVALTLLEGDVLEILLSCRNGSLDRVPVVSRKESACSVTLASGGYPISYEKGKAISISNLPKGAALFHGGGPPLMRVVI